MKMIEIQFPKFDDVQMAEGLNQLKINLSFSGKNINVITVTSSVPNEGKSSVAFNLSCSLADGGKKVLLVDCDLRNSTMISKYHIAKINKGLSHYLSGQANMNDIVYSTKKEHFYMLPSGPFVLDPITLLESEDFTILLQEMRKNFDYIILDTPPLGAVMDPVIIGQNSDGAVIVIEQGVISRKLVQNVVKQLKRADIRVLGAVLNKANNGMDGYGNYGYGYGHEQEKQGVIGKIKNKVTQLENYLKQK